MTTSTTSRARVFATLCVLFACVVYSIQAETTEGTGTGENDTVATTTPGLSSGSPTVGIVQGVTDGVIGGGITDGDVVSTSPTAALSASTTHAPLPVTATSVVDGVTTVTVSVRADDNDSNTDDSDTDVVTPKGDTTTSSGTTQHITDDNDSPAVATSPASNIQKKTTANDMLTTIADDTTQTPDDTPGGATDQPPFVMVSDEPVATESVALDDTDKQTRLQNNLGGALMPVYTMTSFFLEKIVQPHDVTQLKINLSHPYGPWEAVKSQWPTWTVYLVGFIVCASLGLVLGLLIPCVGLCVTCCRCAGRCGGKIDPSDGRRAKCQRICCGLALLIITAALVVAVVAVFALNERLRHQLRADDDSSFDDVTRSIGDVSVYINSTKAEFLTQVVGRCSDHIAGLMAKSERIPAEFLDDLVHSTGVQSALTQMRRDAERLRNTTGDLNTAEQEVFDLRNQARQLQTLLDGVKTNLLTGIGNCTAPECTATRARVEILKVTSNIYDVSLHDLIQLQGNFSEGLDNATDTAEGEIQELRTAANESVQSNIVKFRDRADEAQSELRTAVGKMMTEVDTVNLTRAAEYVARSKTLTKEPAYIIYCCIASLALLVCFIVLCNVIGLLYGSFSRRATLTSDGPCDVDRSVGANWLLAGVGFTFIFYLLLAAATTALFLGGGLVHTEFCRHLVDFNNPRSAEAIDVIEGLTKVPHAALLTSVYSRCRSDESFYSAASLETTNGFNVSRLIDMDKLHEFVAEVADTRIEVPSISRLSPAGEALLRTPTNISELCARLGRDVIDDDLVQLADNLTGLPGVGENIEDNVRQLERIAGNVTRMRSTAERIVAVLYKADEFINASITTIGKLNDSLEAINTNGSTIAYYFMNRTSESIFDGLQTLRTDLQHSIRDDIGRCRPVYDAATKIIDTTCIKILYPINGVWFCLGFCLFILLPSIILSFKLVTLYRKLDSYDESPYEYADPIYDAYRPSDYHDFGDQPREMLIQKLDTTRPRSYEPLGPVDNPVYMMDSEVEPAGPPDSNRPRFFSPGYPVYAKPAENRAVDPGRPSPPPSYASSTGVADASYDTRL